MRNSRNVAARGVARSLPDRAGSIVATPPANDMGFHRNDIGAPRAVLDKAGYVLDATP
jgi:hypothetical protein